MFVKLGNQDQALKLQLFDALQEIAQIGCWELDIKTNTTFWTEEVVKIHGLKSGQNISVSEAIAFYAPEEQHKIISCLEACKLGTSYRERFKFFNAQGEELYIETTGYPIRNSSGEIISLRGTFQNITEFYKKAEEVKLILDQITEGYWDWHLDKDFEYMSPRFWEILGIDFRTKKHHPSEWMDLIHPDDAKSVAQAFERHVQSEGVTPFDLKVRYRHSQGHWIWIRCAGQVIEWGPNKEAIRAVGTHRDVTLEVETERQLRSKEEKLSLALEGASLGAWTWDLKTNQVDYDERWARMRGCERSELKMDITDWESRVHPQDLSKAYQLINDYMNGKSKHFELIHRVKHKNGQWLYIMGRGRFSNWDADGNPILFSGTDFDITEAKRSELITQLVSEIRSEFIAHPNKKQFFDYLLSHLLKVFESEYGFLGEILNDSKGPYLKTFAITDISWDEATRLLYQTMADKGMEFRNLDTLFGQVIKTGELLLTNDPANHPASKGLPKGHPPLKAFMGVPIYYNKKFIAMIGLANAPGGYLSNEVKWYQPLFDSIGEMINAIILQEQVESQKKIAMHHAKLASIGEMAAGVGHEINNPLAIISGQMTLLKKQFINQYGDNPDFLQKFEKVTRSVSRIANIVQGLRTFARSDDTLLGPVNISQIITESIAMMRDLYKTDQVIFIDSIAADLWIQGNAGRIQQVIINLLNNAKDAVEKAEKKIVEISAHMNHQFVRIRIKDTGCGIPESLREKIFQPFFTTKEVNKGTGIGLSLSLSIIQEHNGKLELKSEVNQGTEFIIEFQLLSQPAKLSQTQDPIPLSQSLENSFKAIKILIVDDEQDLREALAEILAEANLTVLLAENGQQAQQVLLQNSDIQVIISDMKMPICDGPTLLKQIRSNGYAGKFYFITGGVDIDLKSITDIYTGILPKPFDEAQIKTLLLTE